MPRGSSKARQVILHKAGPQTVLIADHTNDSTGMSQITRPPVAARGRGRLALRGHAPILEGLEPTEKSKMKRTSNKL